MLADTSPDHAPETDAFERPGVNWSGTVDYGPGPLHAPTTIAALQELVGHSRRLRPLGTRHSFSEIAVGGTALVSLAAMPTEIEVDTAARTVRVAGQVRYGDLALAVHAQGLALKNMGSLPHISVAGATSTGTHGSGDRRPSLTTSIRALELVTANGELLTLSRATDPEIFDGAALALGTLGVITHLTLDLVPAVPMRQSVHVDFPESRLAQDDLMAMFAAGSSVSLFHRFDGSITQAWVKQVEGVDAALPDRWLGGQRSRGGVHPLPGLPGTFCTDQTSEPGPAHERLPHFRLEFTPSYGEEIQSEYFLPREHLAEALAALAPLREKIQALLLVSELRTVAADQLWLSPAHERDSACLHFTWKPLPEELSAFLPELEERLAPFAPRPHWGKVFTTAPEQVRAQYPRLGDFLALRDRLDPERVFTNAYVDRLLGE